MHMSASGRLHPAYRHSVRRQGAQAAKQSLDCCASRACVCVIYKLCARVGTLRRPRCGFVLRAQLYTARYRSSCAQRDFRLADWTRRKRKRRSSNNNNNNRRHDCCCGRIVSALLCAHLCATTQTRARANSLASLRAMIDCTSCCCCCNAAGLRFESSSRSIAYFLLRVCKLHQQVMAAASI